MIAAPWLLVSKSSVLSLSPLIVEIPLQSAGHAFHAPLAAGDKTLLRRPDILIAVVRKLAGLAARDGNAMLTTAKNALKAFVRSCGYTVRRVDNTQFFDFDALLYFQLQRRGELCFVQIGSCDGVSFDPIRGFVERNQSQIRGIVIEPLPDLFRQLQANYRRFPRIVPVNCAVHNSEREMILHRVDPQRLADVPDWACGIASFDPAHHQRLGIPAECMTTEHVPCRTLPDILLEHPLPSIDLLQIDTEGYDSEIILGLDFLEICPTIVRFEHGLHNGSTSQIVFQQVVDRLHGAGYEVILVDCDAVAFQRNIALPDPLRVPLSAAHV